MKSLRPSGRLGSSGGNRGRDGNARVPAREGREVRRWFRRRRFWKRRPGPFMSQRSHSGRWKGEHRPDEQISRVRLSNHRLPTLAHQRAKHQSLLFQRCSRAFLWTAKIQTPASLRRRRAERCPTQTASSGKGMADPFFHPTPSFPLNLFLLSFASLPSVSHLPLLVSRLPRTSQQSPATNVLGRNERSCKFSFPGLLSAPQNPKERPRILSSL
jgi:hypothetical protein